MKEEGETSASNISLVIENAKFLLFTQEYMNAVKQCSLALRLHKSQMKKLGDIGQIKRQTVGELGD